MKHLLGIPFLFALPADTLGGWCGGAGFANQALPIPRKQIVAEAG